MQMTSVMNGLVVGKLSGLDTNAALRTGMIGAAIGGTPQMATVMSLLLARRELARKPLLVVRPDKGDGKDGNGKPVAIEEQVKKLDARMGAVEKSVKASQDGITKIEKSVTAVGKTLDQTNAQVERMAKAMPQSTQAAAPKKGS